MGAVRDRSLLIACIGAGSAIVAAFAKPIIDAFTTEGPVSQPLVAAAPINSGGPADSPVTPMPGGIEGAWKQYIVTKDEGDVYLGTFVVARSHGEYVISPRTQVEGERYQDSIGVFDVSYDGKSWTFNSKWDDGDVGNYELRRVSPTVFEGEIRVAGKMENLTRVVKIE